MKLKKIISGGQTGVDQAVLKAALEVDMPYGGWCPPDRKNEEGEIPAEFNLEETPREHSQGAPDVPRSLRTEWNVRDADATVILRPKDMPDAGSEWALKATKMYHKHSFELDPRGKFAKPTLISWLRSKKVQTVHIAGPANSTWEDAEETCYPLLKEVFAKLK